MGIAFMALALGILVGYIIGTTEVLTVLLFLLTISLGIVGILLIGLGLKK